MKQILMLDYFKCLKNRLLGVGMYFANCVMLLSRERAHG